MLYYFIIKVNRINMAETVRIRLLSDVRIWYNVDKRGGIKWPLKDWLRK